MDFCRQEVELIYKESDHIHIIAICSALEAGVRVEYMNRGDGDQVIAHDFPDGCKPNVFFSVPNQGAGNDDKRQNRLF